MTGDHQETGAGLPVREPKCWSREPGVEAYIRMSLRDLAARIVEQGDPRALAELHRRTPFWDGDDGPLTLTGFVDRLRRRAQGRRRQHADRAYDLTLDRFFRLPETGASTENVGDPSRPERRAGPDCRRYFGAFLQYLAERSKQVEGMSGLEREMLEAGALQGLVQRHFRWALIEAQRSGEWTRYIWRLPTGELTVLLPRHLFGQERPAWLQEHVGEADARRQGERDRVQAIIDGAFPYHHLQRSEGRCDWLNPALGSPPPIPGEEVVDVAEAGLAETVAREKAATIDEQRPAIRALGPERLAEMIRKIFDGLTEEGFELARIAEEYAVSKPTMTRFAGTQWAAGDAPRAAAIPDLWRNTARVLGSHPDFVEAAREAGVWPRVEEARNESRP